MLFGFSTELFRQVHVFDWQQAELHIAVERFCADSFLSLKSSIDNSPTGTCIQRPFIFPEMLADILKKRGGFKASVFPAAFLTMFEIDRISDICLVSPDLAIVQQNRATHDFILYGIIRSSQFFGNSVYCLFVFVPSHLNDMPFFACQVLTFSVFCGIIAFVHSDDSFRIGVWLLNSTTESSLWILFFTIAASFYILHF